MSKSTVEIIVVHRQDIPVYAVHRAGAVIRWARGLDGKLYKTTRTQGGWMWEQTDKTPPSGLVKKLDFETPHDPQ